MVKNLFGLALRQATGMIASLLKLSGLDWPATLLQHALPSPKALAGLYFLSPQSHGVTPAGGEHRYQNAG